MYGVVLVIFLVRNVWGSVLSVEESSKLFPRLEYTGRRDGDGNAVFSYWNQKDGESFFIPQDLYITIESVLQTNVETVFHFDSPNACPLKLFKSTLNGATQLLSTNSDKNIELVLPLNSAPQAPIVMFISSNCRMRIRDIISSFQVSNHVSNFISELLWRKKTPTIRVFTYQLEQENVGPDLITEVDESHAAFRQASFFKKLNEPGLSMAIDSYYRDLTYDSNATQSPILSLSQTQTFFPQLRLKYCSIFRTEVNYETRNNIGSTPLPQDRYLTLYSTRALRYSESPPSQFVTLKFDTTGYCKHSVSSAVQLNGWVFDSHPVSLWWNEDRLEIRYNYFLLDTYYSDKTNILLYVPLGCRLKIRSIQRKVYYPYKFSYFQLKQARKIRSISLPSVLEWL